MPRSGIRILRLRGLTCPNHQASSVGMLRIRKLLKQEILGLYLAGSMASRFTKGAYSTKNRALTVGCLWAPGGRSNSFRFCRVSGKMAPAGHSTSMTSSSKVPQCPWLGIAFKGSGGWQRNGCLARSSMGHEPPSVGNIYQNEVDLRVCRIILLVILVSSS